MKIANAPAAAIRPQAIHLATLQTHVAFARLFADAAAWSMDTDTPADLDAFALFIDVSHQLRGARTFQTWSEVEVAMFPSYVRGFCNEHHIFEPDDISEQLALFFAFLDETGWRQRINTSSFHPEPIATPSRATSPVPHAA